MLTRPLTPATCEVTKGFRKKNTLKGKGQSHHNNFRFTKIGSAGSAQNGKTQSGDCAVLSSSCQSRPSNVLTGTNHRLAPSLPNPLHPQVRTQAEPLSET